MRSPAEMVDLFRARGLKVTPQRECIFRILDGNDVHPTAEAVYAEARRHMPTLALKTVYQTLNDLAEMGEVQLLDVGTGSSRFDPNVRPHHHLVCRECGAVRDVDVDVEGLRVADGELRGFLVETADVVFRGLCARCTVRPGATGATVRRGPAT